MAAKGSISPGAGHAGTMDPFHNHKRSSASKTAWMMKNTDTPIHTISTASLKPDATAVESKAGYETLCSYNWLKDGSAILVPGGPPQWNPRPLPTILRQDTGNQFVDQNAFRVPKYPFEPAFQSLSAMNQSLQLDDIDVIANRNSLRKLLDFAAGRRQDPFRMDLHMVKDTLFISRREKTARLMIRGDVNSGYGHSFETAFTRPQAGLNPSSSHHRVIRYQLGCLDCVVQFEVDACYEDDQTQALPNAPEVPVDDVIASLTSLSVSQVRAGTVADRSTRVILKGTFVGSAKLAELKTRKTERVNQAMPQLWFGRTPYLITGRHVAGTVHLVSCTNVGEKFEDWETTNQDILRKLVSLLTELKTTVRATKGRTAIVLCREKGAPLSIFSTKETVAVLPLSITKRHWRLEENGGS